MNTVGGVPVPLSDAQVVTDVQSGCASALATYQTTQNAAILAQLLSFGTAERHYFHKEIDFAGCPNGGSINIGTVYGKVWLKVTADISLAFTDAASTSLVLMIGSAANTLISSTLAALLTPAETIWYSSTTPYVSAMVPDTTNPGVFVNGGAGGLVIKVVASNAGGTITSGKLYPTVEWMPRGPIVSNYVVTA
jgi:hypothetical protein